MPDGFSSVADLRVVVDASADQFHAGISGVLGALDSLGSKGGESLGGLDKMLAQFGVASLSVSGKVKMLTASVEAGIELYQKFAAEGRAVAEQLGVTTEYDSLIASINDLGMSIQDSAVGSFFALQAASTEAASQMLGFSSSMNVATDSSQSFAATLINAVKRALDTVRLELRLFTSDWATNSNQLDETLRLVDNRISDLNDRIAKMRSGELASEQKGIFSTRSFMDEALKELNKREEERNQILARRAALPTFAWDDPSTVTTYTSLLGDQIQALERRAAAMRMSSAAAAEFNAINAARDAAQRQGIVLSDYSMEVIREEAAQMARLTREIEAYSEAKREEERARALAEQRERSESNTFASAEREITNLQTRARAMTMTADAAGRLALEERMLQQLRQSGVDVTDEHLIKIKALGEEYQRQSIAIAKQQQQLMEFGDTGRVIAGGLQSAFSEWARSGEMDTKKMVSSMLMELSRLALMKTVLEPLFGGGSSGGGGMFSEAMSSIFGGFRADGGPVEAGRSYVVGERGPELFVPSAAGAIVPNTAAGKSVHVVTNIDARGASPDAIAELRRAMAERDASLPQQVLLAVQEGRDRGLT